MTHTNHHQYLLLQHIQYYVHLINFEVVDWKKHFLCVLKEHNQKQYEGLELTQHFRFLHKYEMMQTYLLSFFRYMLYVYNHIAFIYIDYFIH